MEASRDEHGSGASRGRGEPVWCARLTVSELTHRERPAGSGIGIGDPDSRPAPDENDDSRSSGRILSSIESEQRRARWTGLYPVRSWQFRTPPKTNSSLDARMVHSLSRVRIDASRAVCGLGCRNRRPGFSAAGRAER